MEWAGSYQPSFEWAGSTHDGGKLIMGPDNHLYAVIGDLTSVAGQLQNLKSTGK
jgi:glucose/arabinose dehydrogenase